MLSTCVNEGEGESRVKAAASAALVVGFVIFGVLLVDHHLDR